MSIRKMQEILLSIGLAEKESALYLAALKIGTNPVSTLAKEAGIERSTTYSIIEHLKKKGYIMEFKKGSMRLYTAAEPRRILNYLKYQQSDLDEKIKDLTENINSFDGLKTTYHSRPSINLLEGKNSIIYIYENMLSEGKPIKTILSMADVDEKLKKYFKSFTTRRIFKKIPIKIITKENTLDEIPELINKEFCEMRFLEKDYAENQTIPASTINIYGEKAALISTKNESVILIDNAASTEMFTQLFNLTWRISQKKDPRFGGI